MKVLITDQDKKILRVNAMQGKRCIWSCTPFAPVAIYITGPVSRKKATQEWVVPVRLAGGSYIPHFEGWLYNIFNDGNSLELDAAGDHSLISDAVDAVTTEEELLKLRDFVELVSGRPLLPHQEDILKRILSTRSTL